MINSVSVALSGLKAAGERLNNSANNVANAQSTGAVRDGIRLNEPFVPQQVVQSSVEPLGGVRTSLQAVSRPSIPFFDPSNARADENTAIEYPNVSLEGEAVNQIIAENDYKANLQVIKRSNEMLKNLLDGI